MRLVREEKGQAVVEFSLVVSLLLLMLLGIFLFGQAMHAYLSLTYASREGARAAALGGSDAEVSQAVLEALPETVDHAAVTTVITPPREDRLRGTAITVRVSYPLTIDIPLLVKALGTDRWTLVGATTMRAE